MANPSFNDDHVAKIEALLNASPLPDGTYVLAWRAGEICGCERVTGATTAVELVFALDESYSGAAILVTEYDAASGLRMVELRPPNPQDLY